MAVVVSCKSSEHGQRNEARHRKPSNKTKITLYKSLISLQVPFKKLYISNNTEGWSYEGGCDVRLLKHLKKC